ncbi:LmbE family N-acetylglucosaminyl deacetylase [Kineosphaera limosa]|uniref:Hydrolase n=1 Tax=Kineosphaera limosa NBRC 100340 TaxID=1184609 RepID=K6WRJ7_9MICO|nr:PIG-L family deacetylase [Kineosphaera limosa]NYE01761.1 LmbE family N-acetylglucosaminyl deacetylase [Kineosphaera limosa]GAB96441.1 hypothetical protein KILIM_039_00150 [Kineosphaera limosa NBRC 100340]
MFGTVAIAAAIVTPVASASGAPATAITTTTAVATTTPASGVAPATAASGAASTANSQCRRSPVVYLVPHQDDEVLSMAASIRRMVGRSGAACVHLVLVTDGISSGARTSMARGWVPVGGSGVVRVSLTPAQFGAARDREFRAAAARLGVPAANVHLGLPKAPRVPALTPAASRQIVSAAIDRFGTRAGYTTMSDSDPLADHRNLGTALRQVGATRKVSSTSFLYPPYRMPAPRQLSPTVATNDADRIAIRQAAAEYGRYDPRAGRYGIGWVSVPQQFGGPALTLRFVSDGGQQWSPGPIRSPNVALYRGYVSYLHR